MPLPLGANVPGTVPPIELTSDTSAFATFCWLLWISDHQLPCNKIFQFAASFANDVPSCSASACASVMASLLSELAGSAPVNWSSAVGNSVCAAPSSDPNPPNV